MQRDNLPIVERSEHDGIDPGTRSAPYEADARAVGKRVVVYPGGDGDDDEHSKEHIYCCRQPPRPLRHDPTVARPVNRLQT